MDNSRKNYQFNQDGKSSIKMESSEDSAEWCPDENEFLRCQETLDRSSPTLWPQPVPGLLNFLRQSEPEWKLEEGEWDMSKMDVLEADDYELICIYREAKPGKLLDNIQELNDLAYTLSIEESKELNRGVILNIFNNPENGSLPVKPKN